MKTNKGFTCKCFTCLDYFLATNIQCPVSLNCTVPLTCSHAVFCGTMCTPVYWTCVLDMKFCKKHAQIRSNKLTFQTESMTIENIEICLDSPP